MQVLILCLLLSAVPAVAAEPLDDAREIARWLASSGIISGSAGIGLFLLHVERDSPFEP